MTKSLGYFILVSSMVVASVLVASRPDWVSDNNSFLKNFVNHEFLNLLGVILAITLASIAQIHFEFNKIEERAGKLGLAKSRANLRKNTHWLIGLFVLSFAIVIAKPIVPLGATWQAVANTASLVIVVWHVLILISLTHLAFAIGPDIGNVDPN